MSTKLKYGPNTAQVERLIERVARMTPEEVDVLAGAWTLGTGKAWDRACMIAWTKQRMLAWDAARTANRYRCPDRAWPAVQDAATALVVRDLVDKYDFEALVRPVVKVLGRCWEDEA